MKTIFKPATAKSTPNPITSITKPENPKGIFTDYNPFENLSKDIEICHYLKENEDGIIVECTFETLAETLKDIPANSTILLTTEQKNNLKEIPESIWNGFQCVYLISDEKSYTILCPNNNLKWENCQSYYYKPRVTSFNPGSTSQQAKDNAPWIHSNKKQETIPTPPKNNTGVDDMFKLVRKYIEENNTSDLGRAINAAYGARYIPSRDVLYIIKRIYQTTGRYLNSEVCISAYNATQGSVNQNNVSTLTEILLEYTRFYKEQREHIARVIQRVMLEKEDKNSVFMKNIADTVRLYIKSMGLKIDLKVLMQEILGK